MNTSFVTQTETLQIKIRRSNAPDVDIRLPAAVWPRLQDIMPGSCKNVITNKYGDFDHFRSVAEAAQPTLATPFSLNQGDNTISLWFSKESPS